LGWVYVERLTSDLYMLLCSWWSSVECLCLQPSRRQWRYVGRSMLYSWWTLQDRYALHGTHYPHTLPNMLGINLTTWFVSFLPRIENIVFKSKLIIITTLSVRGQESITGNAMFIWNFSATFKNQQLLISKYKTI